MHKQLKNILGIKNESRGEKPHTVNQFSYKPLLFTNKTRNNHCLKIPYRPINFLLFLFITVIAIQAAEEITITASSYVRTTPSNPTGHFKGWGVNCGGISAGGYYPTFPQEKRDKWVNMFWKDLDLRGIRIPAGNGIDINTIYSAAQLESMFGLYLQDIKKQQTNPLIMIFDPHAGWKSDNPLTSWSHAMTDSLLRDYIVRNADVIKDLYDNYGWRMDYVEITNEPQVYVDHSLSTSSPYYSWNNAAYREKALSMTKIWREELDRRGLTYVKILGPSKSGVAALFDNAIINDFKNDSEAMRVWAGYSFHSYTSPLLKAVVDQLAEVDVDIFETESGQAPEQRGLANAISDVNLGTSHWQHFQAYSWGKGITTTEVGGVRLAPILYPGTDSVDVYPYPRFYYFRELMKSVPFGSRVHFCTAHQPTWTTLSATIQSRYTNMEPTGVEQPPINAITAERPDGHWSLLAFNPDSIPNAYNPYVPYHNTAFNVTFVVPELAESGDQEFTVRTISKSKEETNLANQIMHNGKITIPNLLDGQLLSLRSVNALSATVHIHSTESTISQRQSLTATRIQNGMKINFSINKRACHIKITIFNCKGVKVCELARGSFMPGNHEVIWNDNDIGWGLFVIRLNDYSGKAQYIKVVR